MSIKYKNDKGLNERKSNQGSMSLNLETVDEQLKEERFGLKDQELIEAVAGEKGTTSGDSFDKNIPN
jgi:hypothetical protein